MENIKSENYIKQQRQKIFVFDLKLLFSKEKLNDTL